MFATDTMADHLELERTVWSLGRCLDECDFDGLRQLFTADATVTTAATATGHDALVEQARRRHSRDDGIQHIITNLITDVDVLGGQDPAPGVTEQHEVVPIQPECLADLLHLVDEPVQVPQRRLVRLVAEPGAELVVVVVLDPRGGQVAVTRLEVLVGRSRPAVQQQHPQVRMVADPLDPDLVRTLRRIDRDLPRAAAQHVVPAGIIQIAAHRPLRPVPADATRVELPGWHLCQRGTCRSARVRPVRPGLSTAASG